MSNAKLCDECGAIFPEGTEGAESGVGQITKNIDGRAHTIQQVRDFCPDCVSGRQRSKVWRPDQHRTLEAPPPTDSSSRRR